MQPQLPAGKKGGGGGSEVTEASEPGEGDHGGPKIPGRHGCPVMFAALRARPDSLVVPRAAQYACALAGAALSRSGNGSGDSSDTLRRLQHLEAHLSLGRKRE